MKTVVSITNPILIVMIIGHLIGDFYLQSDKLVEKRKTGIGYLFLHSLIYAICMSTVVLLCIPISIESIKLSASLSLVHLMIDLVKHIISSIYNKHNQNAQNSKIFNILVFFIDQALHIISIGFCYKFICPNMIARSFLQYNINTISSSPLVIILGILLILRPVDIIISKLVFETQSTDKTGKIIGYLERIIIFILLQFGAYSSIAFVLTAKSIARFKAIEENEGRAKYYLIGTLISTSSVIIISFVLGLCGQP